MSTAPSTQDLINAGIAAAQAQRADLLFDEGQIPLAMVHSSAVMCDALLRYAAQRFKDTFLDGAEGDALDRLVDDHIGIQRQAASAAQVTLTISRSDTTNAISIIAGTEVQTAPSEDGVVVTFATDSIAAMGIGVASVDVTATCTEVGRIGNVVAATLVNFAGTAPLDGSSPGNPVTVTNAAAAAGGNEQESDTELRRRAKTFFSTLRRGTLASLEVGARTVSTVRVATASEDGSGNVTVRVADSDGNSTLQMQSDVELALEGYRAAGAQVNVVGGAQLAVNVDVTVFAEDGYSVTAQSTVIDAAITAVLAQQEAGETLYLDRIRAAIVGLDPAIQYVTIADPSADVTATSAQVIRAGTITIAEGS